MHTRRSLFRSSAFVTTSTAGSAQACSLSHPFRSSPFFIGGAQPAALSLHASRPLFSRRSWTSKTSFSSKFPDPRPWRRRRSTPNENHLTALRYLRASSTYSQFLRQQRRGLSSSAATMSQEAGLPRARKWSTPLAERLAGIIEV